MNARIRFFGPLLALCGIAMAPAIVACSSQDPGAITCPATNPNCDERPQSTSTTPSATTTTTSHPVDAGGALPPVDAAAATPSIDAAVSVDASGGTNLAFGVPCVTGPQCQTNLCFDFPANGSFCTKACATSADCPNPALGCNGMAVCKVQ